MSESSLSEKQWAMLCHASAFIGYIIPFGNIIGPLVIYLLKKDESPIIADQSKESLNFQITITLLAMVSFILILVLIGIFLLMALAAINIIFIIIAIIKTDEGKLYKYPYKLEFIR